MGVFNPRPLISSSRPSRCREEGLFECNVRSVILASMTTATKNEIRKNVNTALREVLSDPDFGIPLSSAFTRRLRKSIASAEKGRIHDLTVFLKKR